MGLLHYFLFAILSCSIPTFSSQANLQPKYEKCDKIKSNIRCRFDNNSNETCHSILGSDLPFSCWGAPCSMDNEAYWLGTLAFYNNLHLFANKNNSIQSVQAINFLWPKFAHMTDHGGLPIDDEGLKKFEFPNYARNLRNSKPRQRIVPLICDPKANLYCENSFHVGVTYNKHGQILSKCMCNPLYSVMVEKDWGGEQQGHICLSRANTPCGFEIEDAFSDEEELLIKLQPAFLRDGTFSRCMEHTKCLPFRDEIERNSFREGNMWQGFGYSPIIADIVLKTTTRICKCDEGYVENRMFDCVKLKPK